MKVEVEITQEFLQEVWQLARSSGAIAHWADIASAPEPFRMAVWNKETLGARERPPPYMVDLSVIERGLSRVFDPELEIEEDARMLLIAAVLFNNATLIRDHEGVCVDVVVQLAIFGQVIYG